MGVSGAGERIILFRLLNERLEAGKVGSLGGAAIAELVELVPRAKPAGF
jgi:hypothetical protein